MEPNKYCVLKKFLIRGVSCHGCLINILYLVPAEVWGCILSVMELIQSLLLLRVAYHVMDPIEYPEPCFYIEGYILPWVLIRAVLATHDARIIAIFPAGNGIDLNQTNDYHLQHIFQVLINLHGQESTKKHPYHLVLF